MMKKAQILVGFIFLVILNLIPSPSFAVTVDGKVDNNGALESKSSLFEYNPKTFEFEKLTPAGVKALQRARDALVSRNTLFEQEFKKLSTIHHAALVARMVKGNMFLYGPPGGAKSAFVNWLMKGEDTPPFALQLNQMMSEQVFTGGQNFEAAKEGRFEINTEGSLAGYKVALIDETEKGNPAALSALLSLLNERKVLAGNKVIDSKLETLFATSNANLPEIFEQFRENGQGSTAPALLNRFQFKAFVYNWLSDVEDQAILDCRRLDKSYKECLAQFDSEVRKNDVFLEPEQVNWPEIRLLAKVLFRPSSLFMTGYREIVNEMRKQTNNAIRASEERHQQNHLDEPYVYFPSADYTERLRQQIPDIILISAFIDFLQSPLASDENLASLKQIELDPVSLWRSYLVMTTLVPGETKLEADSDHVDINFGWKVDSTEARDQRESLLLKNLKDEQERFREVYVNYLENLKKECKKAAEYSTFQIDSNAHGSSSHFSGNGDNTLERNLLNGSQGSFEFLIMNR